MASLLILFGITVIMGTFVYTVNFARWLLKRKQVRGAIGVFGLAVLTVAVPLIALLGIF